MREPLRVRMPALLVAGVLTAGLLVSCGEPADGEDAAGPAGLHAAVPDTPYRLADATLVDQAGHRFVLRDHLHRPLTLVFFGYTHCPDVCQAVMADLASARARLDRTEADRLGVWFVTTDPARDTPAVLGSYVSRFDPSFVGLTGPLRTLASVADSLHLAMERGRRLPSGGYEVTHTTAVLGVLPDGSVPLVWPQGTSAAKIAEDVHQVLADGVPTPTSRSGS